MNIRSWTHLLRPDTNTTVHSVRNLRIYNDSDVSIQTSITHSKNYFAIFSFFCSFRPSFKKLVLPIHHESCCTNCLLNSVIFHLLLIFFIGNKHWQYAAIKHNTDFKPSYSIVAEVWFPSWMKLYTQTLKMFTFKRFSKLIKCPLWYFARQILHL